MEPLVGVPGATRDDSLLIPVPEPSERPEVHLTPRQWMRENLFPSIPGTILTLLFGALLAYAAYRLAWFVLVSADWEVVRRNLRVFMIGQFPEDQIWRLWAALSIAAGMGGLLSGATAARAEDEARSSGQAYARPGRLDWLRRYWPALAAIAIVLSLTRSITPTLLAVAVGALVVIGRLAGRYTAWLARFSWLGVVIAAIAAFVLIGGPGGVGWGDWGGFHLTAFMTIAGIALSFPLGVIAALGRRSQPIPTSPKVWIGLLAFVAVLYAILAAGIAGGVFEAGPAITVGVVIGLGMVAMLGVAVRVVSIAYIELIRGVPLVTLLFMGQYVVPLVYPNTVDPPSALARGLIAITLFEAAYVAETVRGGLQSIPRGQIEAAQAIGLPAWKVTRQIVLPQALRAVIPAMVGQFISLFKDTSLLQIIGFLEFLHYSDSVLSQRDFTAKGLHTVTYAFAALIYWAGSYTMSRESRRLERRLGIGERR